MSGGARIAKDVGRRLGGVNEAIGVGGRNIAGALLVAMTGVIVVQVVSRYVFNNSISWTEELSKSLMVWTAFLVAPWAYRHGANVSIDMFAEALPFRVRATLTLTITTLTIWILAIFFIESLPFVARGMHNRSATLPVPSGLFYLILPVSLGAMIAVGIERFLFELSELLTGAADPQSPARALRTEA